MNEREQDIKNDNAFFIIIIIVVIAMMIITVCMLWFASIDGEEFQNEFNTWNCSELKHQLESDDHSQYREQMILKKLHIDDCYGK